MKEFFDSRNLQIQTEEPSDYVSSHLSTPGLAAERAKTPKILSIQF